MNEFSILIRNIVVVATGLYLLASFVLTAVNPYDNMVKTVLWSFGILLGLSMLMLPLTNEWLVSLAR